MAIRPRGDRGHDRDRDRDAGPVGHMAPPPSSSAVLARPSDMGCVVAGGMGDKATSGRLGILANARPPSPFIGARTIVAMQWVVFGACVARWLVF